MQTVSIDLGQRSYPIHIGSGLLDQRGLIAGHVRNRAMVVTNETIAPLYLDQTLASLGNIPSCSVILPDGESFKNLDELNRIFTALLNENFDRGCTLIALGGGVSFKYQPRCLLRSIHQWVAKLGLIMRWART